MKKSKGKNRIVTVLVVLLAIGLLAGILLWFRAKMDSEIDTTTRSYLSKNVGALAGVFRAKMEDKLVMLEAQARYFKNVDLNDYNLMKKTIMATKGIGSFRSIGVATPSGATMNYNGKAAGNIYLQECFHEAMDGKRFISSKPMVDEHGDEVIVMAVPIKQPDGIPGVVYGTFTSGELRNLLDMYRFDPLGANILITEDGTILSTNAESRIVTRDMENISELIPGFTLTPGKDEQYYSFSSGGKGFILVLTPVRVHDWYFGTILPENVMTDQLTRFSQYMVSAMIAIIIVFFLLTIYIVVSSRKNEKERRELDDKASRDSLTRLLNKLDIVTAVRNALGAAGPHDRFVLCMVDIDDFKSVNDTYGHAAGDAVIKGTADRLKQIFRAGDAIGRVGGDEFSAFLYCPNLEDGHFEEFVSNRAERILEEMSVPFSFGGTEIAVSVSLGFAGWPGQGRDYEELYKNADKALYAAKQGGKDRYEICH